MKLNQDNYDIIEVFEENANQLVLLAIENSQYESVVIINKLTKSNIINDAFIRGYKQVSETLISIDELEEQVIFINTYKDTQLLFDFLVENTLDFNERIRIAKSFLSQISKYEIFEPAIQNIFIRQDQLTIKNNILIFSDYVFFEFYNSDILKDHLMMSIGQILDLILQLHKESLDVDISAIKAFIHSLQQAPQTFSDYNAVYNTFKILATNLSDASDVIHYTNLSELEVVEKESTKVDLNYILDKKHTRDLDKNQHTSDLLYDHENTIQEDLLYGDETDIQEDLLGFKDSEDDVFMLDTPDTNLESHIAFSDDELDINPNFLEDFQLDDFETSDTFEGSEVHDIQDTFEDEITSQDEDTTDQNITAEILSILGEMNLNTQAVNTDPVDEDFDEALDTLLPDALFESWLDKESFDLVEDLDHLDETTASDSEDEIISAQVLEIIQDPEDSIPTLDDIVLELETESTLDLFNTDDTGDEIDHTSAMDSNLVMKSDLEEPSVSNPDFFNLDVLVPEVELTTGPETVKTADMKETPRPMTEDEDIFSQDLLASHTETDSTTNEPLRLQMPIEEQLNVIQDIELKQETTIKKDQEPKDVTSLDQINDILNRNNKDYGELYLLDEKKAKKAYYVPSFVAFFIALLIITSLLLYYTSTYI